MMHIYKSLICNEEDTDGRTREFEGQRSKVIKVLGLDRIFTRGGEIITTANGRLLYPINNNDWLIDWLIDQSIDRSINWSISISQ